MFSAFSTITTWGKEGEIEAFRNMLTQFPTGLMACVSDSYNIWNACEKVGKGVVVLVKTSVKLLVSIGFWCVSHYLD